MKILDDEMMKYKTENGIDAHVVVIIKDIMEKGFKLIQMET